MSKCCCYTLRNILAEMFVDKNSDFDLDVADYLLYSSKHMCETSWQDSVELMDSF